MLGLWFNKRLFVDFAQRGKEPVVGDGRQGAAYGEAEGLSGAGRYQTGRGAIQRPVVDLSQSARTDFFYRQELGRLFECGSNKRKHIQS